MSARKPQPILVTLPAKAWLRRALQIFLVLSALMLLSMSKAGNPAAVKLRATVLDTVTPVMEVVASPFDAMANAGQWFTDVVDTHAQNIALKNENVQLLQWQQMAKRLSAENESLKRLMNAIPMRKQSYITARLVADIGGPFSQSALINGGKEHGVKIDQAVINEDGLIGRVMEVGEGSARVLLLSDINSRIPVIAEHAREKSMLTGNNHALPVLSYLAVGSRIGVGERLVTSGDGGIFPAGVPVGEVVSIDGGVVTVQPFADMAHIEYVSVIDYKF